MGKNRLFLSYGKPEIEIVRRIRKVLLDAGYDVWMDESELKAGDDWRERIFDGIRESNGVIACLSRHSVREPGVCRNELSIAIGVRGGNIKTILLEDEDRVKIPADLSHSQWLDMHDWKLWLSRGEEAFESWFQEKMSCLLEMLKSEKEFAGEIELLRKILRPNSSRSRQGALLSRPFFGREWLADRLVDWIDREKGEQLLLLYGEPGLGKSTFMAQFAYHNPRVAGGIFCERWNTSLNHPAVVIRTMAFQLACRLPEYRRVLLWVLRERPQLEKQTSSELFDCLLSDPLMNLYIDGGQENICFVIDGLDECGDAEHNELAKLLSLYGNRLPVWLKLLVSSRETASVTALLGQRASLCLRGNEEENLKDIRQYFSEELKEGWVCRLDELVKASGGVFLYAGFMVRSIREKRLDPVWLKGLPEGLGGKLFLWFDSCFPEQKEYEARFQNFLSLLLAVPEGIPAEEISMLLNLDENQKNGMLRAMQAFLAEGEDWLGNETYWFSHLYLAEWLVQEDAGRFQCSAEAGRKLLFEGLSRKCREAFSQMTGWELYWYLLLFDDNGKALPEKRIFERLMRLGDQYALQGNVSAGQQFYERVWKSLIQAEREHGEKNYRGLIHAAGVRRDLLREVSSISENLEYVEDLRLVEKTIGSRAGDQIADDILMSLYEKRSRLFREQLLRQMEREKRASVFSGLLRKPVRNKDSLSKELQKDQSLKSGWRGDPRLFSLFGELVRLMEKISERVYAEDGECSGEVILESDLLKLLKEGGLELSRKTRRYIAEYNALLSDFRKLENECSGSDSSGEKN